MASLKPAGAVWMQGVSLYRDDGREVLQGVDLRVHAHEFVGLVGPSGCGKTTLLQLLAGLLPAPVTGRLQVLGQAPAAGRGDVVYMPAQDCLLPWRTALDNAAFALELQGLARDQRRRRAATMLERVGLGAFALAHPRTLSQGMRQRVALARSFCRVTRESLLLMDEPFAALDVQTRLQLGELLLALRDDAGGASVLFVTHDLQEAIGLADRVVVLSDRPARVVAEVGIDLERPRRLRHLHADLRFHELYRRLWSALAPDGAPP